MKSTAKFALELVLVALLAAALVWMWAAIYENAGAETGLPSSYNGEIVYPSEVFNELDIDTCVFTFVEQYGAVVERGCHDTTAPGNPWYDLTTYPTIWCVNNGKTIDCPVLPSRVVYQPGMTVSCPAEGGDDSDEAYRKWADGCFYSIASSVSNNGR